jgi:hypothetical protein
VFILLSRIKFYSLDKLKLLTNIRGDKLKVLAIIEKDGIIAYLVTIVSAIIFNMLGFVVINTVIIIILKILYFIILICAIVSFYKSKRKNIISIVLFFLPIILLFTGIPLKLVTMILLLPLFFFKGIKPVIRAIGILVYVLLIPIGIFGLSLGGFGANSIIDQQYSPNGIYRAVTMDSDQGALGGDTFVNLDEMYFGIIKKNIKTLYHGHWGEKPRVIWVDNNNVKIDEKNMNIHTSKTWETKN